MRDRACRRGLTLALALGLISMSPVAPQAQEQLYLGRPLSDWTRLLEDPDPSTALAAVEALRAGFGAQAVPSLLHALEGGERSVRRESVKALATIRPVAPETAAAMARAMRDPDPALRRAAAAALGDAGTVSPLVEALKDPDGDVRRNAVRPLRRIVTRGSSDPLVTREVVAALADAVKETDPRIRRSAAASLGAIGPRAADAIPALTEATRASEPSARDAAIEALGRIGSSGVVPALMQAMKDPRTASLAIRALGAAGPAAREALPALREFRSRGDSGHSAEVETAIMAIERPGTAKERDTVNLQSSLTGRDGEVVTTPAATIGNDGSLSPSPGSESIGRASSN